jgi:hypothetical protein
MLPYSGIQCRVVRVRTDVLEEHITSTFEVKNQLSKKPACNRWLGTCFMLVSCSADFFTSKVEVICSSLTPIHIRNARHYITEDRNIELWKYFRELHLEYQGNEDEVSTRHALPRKCFSCYQNPRSAPQPDALGPVYSEATGAQSFWRQTLECYCACRPGHKLKASGSSSLLILDIAIKSGLCVTWCEAKQSYPRTRPWSL